MFSLRICRYPMSKFLNYLGLKNGETEKKFIKIRGPGKSSPLRIDQSICLGGGDLAVYENLSRGMIALGTDWYKTLKHMHVKRLFRISENWIDGHGFTGGHILILMINCFQKAASARYVTSVWIYAYVCLPKLKWFTVTKPTMHKHKDYFVSKVAQEVLCLTSRTTDNQWINLFDLW